MEQWRIFRVFFAYSLQEFLQLPILPVRLREARGLGSAVTGYDISTYPSVTVSGLGKCGGGALIVNEDT